MNIIDCSDYNEMSQKCSDSILSGLKENPGLLLCCATGNSPTGVYSYLAKAYLKKPKTFERVRILKLDEWGGILSTDPNSCETYVRQKILQPLHIHHERYISFDGNPASPEMECERIQSEIEKKGPIDICILGLGQNGHIGFNEPSDALHPNCHIARLSKESFQHQMALGMQNKPTYGITLGMANILQSKKIILLLTGAHKKKAIDYLRTKKINTQLPASFLWLHPHVECYVDLNCI